MKTPDELRTITEALAIPELVADVLEKVHRHLENCASNGNYHAEIGSIVRGFSPRTVRAAISELRKQGFVVASSQGNELQTGAVTIVSWKAG